MVSLLDREMQGRILKELAEIYPQKADIRSLADYGGPGFEVNLLYLREHGLLNSLAKELVSGEFIVDRPVITARGLDFLQDDGGLSAILGVVTIRLHDDTIKQLLISRVQNSEADPTTKDQLINVIQSLPAEATKSVAMRVIEAGLESIPDAIQLLQRWLSL